MKTVTFFLFLFINTSLFANERNPFFPDKTKHNDIKTSLTEKKITANNNDIEGHQLAKTKSAETVNHRVYSLNYAEATQLSQQLNHKTVPLLSPKGHALAEIESNSLLIEDTDKALAKIEDWLKIKDTPQQQVHITAHIVSSSQEALNEIGAQWALQSSLNAVTTSKGSPSAPSTHSSLAIHQNTKNPLHYIAINIARINSRLLELELSALEQEKQLSIIASPRLTAAHEKTASIKQGTEIPYVSLDNENARVQFKEAVLGMEVTPIIQRNNKIRLILKISQNTPGIALVQGGSEHLSIDKQEISTEITINDGETLMLGGIFQQKQQNHIAKIPLLSSLPLIGMFFSHKRTQQSRHELVIFITPKLI